MSDALTEVTDVLDSTTDVASPPDAETSTDPHDNPADPAAPSTELAQTKRELGYATAELEQTRDVLKRREDQIRQMRFSSWREGFAKESGVPVHLLRGGTPEEVTEAAEVLTAWRDEGKRRPRTATPSYTRRIDTPTERVADATARAFTN